MSYKSYLSYVSEGASNFLHPAKLFLCGTISLLSYL